MKTKAYACYNKDEDIRLKSSSGGIYYLLAKEVLCKGGVVFAACYDGLNVKHKIITGENELIESLGSKYMPSELGNTFKAVKDELKNGMTVLFAGFPCQCGGLLSYIEGCGTDLNNLITVDLICHGVPTGRAWKSYCNSLRNKGFNPVFVNMRDKSSGWKNYSWKLTDLKGSCKIQLYTDNAYMNGFIDNLYLRPSCSSCRFKGTERKTDITLGDYWGVNKEQPEMDDDRGTSLVFIHSEAGQELFNSVSDLMVFKSTFPEQAVKHNSSAVISSEFPDKREDFFRRLAEGEDFCGLVKDLTGKPIAVRIKRKVKNMIKKLGGGN
ncbi:MAG: Coenzyme F420 hydrogenase/dehydrogenase, beta subunit C-terminal domain [Eubacterium sp.]|nr:Coenzyme F420 hydrogenase/dehydrogenase, beta subunit C-terminal domain [Eubacterium sp.]